MRTAAVLVAVGLLASCTPRGPVRDDAAPPADAPTHDLAKTDGAGPDATGPDTEPSEASPSELAPPPEAGPACVDAGPPSVTVRFDLRRSRDSRGHEVMIAAIAVPAMGVHDDVFNSPTPDICASTIDHDGARLRLRCKGDLVETRGEILREEGGVRIRVTSGYFGLMPPGQGTGWTLRERFVATRCGARVLFEPHTLSDMDRKPHTEGPEFYRELTEPDRPP